MVQHRPLIDPRLRRGALHFQKHLINKRSFLQCFKSSASIVSTSSSSVKRYRIKRLIFLVWVMVFYLIYFLVCLCGLGRQILLEDIMKSVFFHIGATDDRVADG